MPYLVPPPPDSAFGTTHPLATFPTPLIAGRYTLRAPDGAALPPLRDATEEMTIKPLGGGGFSTVVRAVDTLDLPRAIKFLDPPVLCLRTDGTDLFRQEIALTTRVPLKHTLPILDFHHAQDFTTRQFYFYVMPYVHGYPLGRLFTELLRQHSATLHAYPASRALMRDLLLVLVNDVLSAVIELQALRIVHMDLSINNIMVQLPTSTSLADLRSVVESSRAFVIDLGAAKAPFDAPHGGRTLLIRNTAFFPMELLGSSDLGFDGTDSTIDYAKLRSWWRLIDLYCFGRIVEALLLNRVGRHPRFVATGDAPSREATKQLLWQSILGDDFAVFQTVTDRLINIRQPYYSSAAELREVFAGMTLASARDAGRSDLLTDRYRGLRLRTGRTLVKVAAPLRFVVDHPVFQRLKRLSPDLLT